MNHTLTISENLHSRLLSESQARGLSIEQLVEKAVEEWRRQDDELKRREEAVDRIVALRERMREKYGMMPDSVELIREDRER
jgi:catechol-2,3-dioxygenase